MNQPTVLITGGLGCIGSETAKWLLRHSDAAVIVGSRDVSADRIERTFFDVEHERLTFVQLDVRHGETLLPLLREHRVTHVVHMAALQTPACNAHRDLGLQVNLAGTQHLIEAMKECGLDLQRYVFASSIAVYGPRAHYPAGTVPMLAEPQPVNVYGAWKLAGEHISRFFCEDTGVPTVSVRPGVLFGPGRDAGLTSTPTTAMKSVALGHPYEIPFRSPQDYLYAPDVGAAVGHATVDPFDGYGVYTLPSHTRDTQQVVAAIERAAEQLGIAQQCQITVGDEDVPFICELDYAPLLKAFPRVPHTDFETAVQQSLEVFCDQVASGWLVST